MRVRVLRHALWGLAVGLAVITRRVEHEPSGGEFGSLEGGTSSSFFDIFFDIRKGGSRWTDRFLRLADPDEHWRGLEQGSADDGRSVDPRR